MRNWIKIVGGSTLIAVAAFATSPVWAFVLAAFGVGHVIEGGIRIMGDAA